MATQNVTDKILSDAKQEAKEILDKYRKTAQAIIDKYGEKIAVRRLHIEQETDAKKNAKIIHAVSQKRIELTQETVREKQKYISQIINTALETLHSHKEYGVFLKALIKKSGVKDGELFINKQDWKTYGSELEKFMKKEHLDYRITCDSTIKGGIMIHKEYTTYHGSLDIISELLNDQLTIAVSQKLF